TELDGILPCGVCEFIEEALKNPGEGVTAGGTEGVGGNADGHERGTEKEIGNQGGGKLATVDARGGREVFAFTEADEMILPSDDIAGRIETTLEEVIAGGAIVIVVEIVFPGPKKFDGDSRLFGNGCGFKHVVVGETATETSAGAHHVDGDVRSRDVEDLGDLFAATLRSLRRRPEFQFAIVEMGQTVFRLHGGVGNERVGVEGIDGFCGGL